MIPFRLSESLISGIGVALRADFHTASPCDSKRRGLRLSHIAGRAAELASGLHLRNFPELRQREVQQSCRQAREDGF
jgi:hypothetical protein